MFLFNSETNRLDQGLILELWNKGVLWDKLLGVCFMPLRQIKFEQMPGPGQWFQSEFGDEKKENLGKIFDNPKSIIMIPKYSISSVLLLEGYFHS